MRKAGRGVERFRDRRIETESITKSAGAIMVVGEVNEAPRTGGSTRDERR